MLTSLHTNNEINLRLEETSGRNSGVVSNIWLKYDDVELAASAVMKLLTISQFFRCNRKELGRGADGFG